MEAFCYRCSLHSYNLFCDRSVSLNSGYSKFTLFKHRKGEISGDRGILSSRRSLSGPPMVKPIYPGRKKAMKKIKTTIEKLKERYPYLKGFKIVEKEKSIKLNLPEKIPLKVALIF